LVIPACWAVGAGLRIGSLKRAGAVASVAGVTMDGMASGGGPHHDLFERFCWEVASLVRLC
jgi:hypothetical protein